MSEKQKPFIMHNTTADTYILVTKYEEKDSGFTELSETEDLTEQIKELFVYHDQRKDQ